MISISQPQSLLAKRTFCPRRPMASDNWSSFTKTMPRPNIWHRITSSTSAGCNAFGTSNCRSSLHRTISIRSPPSSSTMFLILLPRTPTQAPTQSTRASELITATLLRYPGSREMARISMTPSAISGISCSNNRCTNCGRMRERMILTRLPTFLTSKIVARIRSLG